VNGRLLFCATLVAGWGGAPCLAAQDSLAPAPRTSQTWTRPVVHYGKWLSAASAVGFTLLAAREHDTANRSWQQLLDLCRRDNAACQVGADGRYATYQAELLYQQTLYYDRRARHRLIIGQISMLTSAALFILDLRHGSGNPPNIPFHGLEVTAEPVGDGARLGVRVPF
jgi:hypothetical protein